jgi:Asp-tRNA(Asn)/Glu-tRNA(Gln) amidotransferase A subunit family amidase
MAFDLDWAGASRIASAVKGKEVSALAVVEAALARIERLNPKLNAFTALVMDRARKTAKAIDALSGGNTRGPLAGVPFAVKNLFDVQGLTTVAGSKINRDNAPALKDSPLIARLPARRRSTKPARAAKSCLLWPACRSP